MRRAAPALPSPLPRSARRATRDQAALVDACLAGLLRDTDYPGLEVVLVDNGSRDPEALAVIARWADHPAVRVLRVDEPFNYARLCNLGAAAATGAVLAFVNDDVRPLTRDWLKTLVAFAAKPESGRVPLMLNGPARCSTPGCCGPRRPAGTLARVEPEAALGRPARSRRSGGAR